MMSIKCSMSIYTEKVQEGSCKAILSMKLFFTYQSIDFVFLHEEYRKNLVVSSLFCPLNNKLIESDTKLRKVK